ncbi:MAG: amidohydrolase [Anaerolineae bacterium]|nr:amidohydrolase [Anaerolineae bacterium]
MQIRILSNAKIYTGDKRTPWVNALAVAGERVVATGNAAAAWESAPNTVIEDMGGATIIPGLCDAHIHLMWYALSLREIDLRGCTRAEMLDVIAQKARHTPPGEWILGRGWDQNTWADQRFPTAADLNSITPQHPVALIAKNAHAMVINQVALERTGICENTPDPKHGRIDRDNTSSPTGLFFEDATQLVKRVIPEVDLEDMLSLIAKAQNLLLRQGITSVHDVDGGVAFSAFQELHRRKKLRLRLVKYVRLDLLDGVLAANLHSGYGDDWLRFGGLKLFADGALGSRTAALYESYEGEPGNSGMLTLEPDQLCDLVTRAVRGGIALCIHAIGDLTNHIVLEALLNTQANYPHLRHRIEHVQLINPADQCQLAQTGIVASMQPVHAIHDADMVDQYWAKRGQHAYAFRSLLQQGIPLAFGSDAPIEVFDPFLGMYAAVARRRERNRTPYGKAWYPEQRLNLHEALKAYTWGGAFAAGMEDRLGMLLPGYYADLAVLNRDIFSLPEEALLEVAVNRVMVAGNWILFS